MAKKTTKTKKPYKRKTPQDRTSVLFVHGTKATHAYAQKQGKTLFRGFSNYINYLIAKDMGDAKAVAEQKEIAKTYVLNKSGAKKTAKPKVAKKAVSKKATKKVEKKSTISVSKIKEKTGKKSAKPRAAKLAVVEAPSAFVDISGAEAPIAEAAVA